MALDIKRVLTAAPQKREQQPLAELKTPWGEQIDADNVLQQHPRPQFARGGCIMLHGYWDYAITTDERPIAELETKDSPQQFDGRILVPFSPESTLSEVKRQLKPGQRLWYRLKFTIDPKINLDSARNIDANDSQAANIAPGQPKVVSALGKTLAVKRGQRCLLHFDGIDYESHIWLNGISIACTQGCYQSLSVNIDDAIQLGENELLVCVADPSDTGTQLRGKQCLERGGIWYTAQSGIWQPVWLEAVPETYVQSLNIDADMFGDLRIEAITNAPERPLTVAIFPRGASPEEFKVTRFPAEISKDDPCCQIAKLHLDNAQLWSPENPALYSLEIRCGDDKIHSYCAFRSVNVSPDKQGIPRFNLNGEPYFLRGVLDQGYWPDGLLTAPDDEALVYDIAAMKSLGFNMLRKHIKIENERWYWHCDRLGMLVWQDAPSGGNNYSTWYTSHKPTLFKASWTNQRDDTTQGRKRLSSSDEAMRAEWTATCKHMVQRLRNHPCVVTWVLFNEGWGQFDSRKATEAVRQLDPTRPIDATSGWYDQACGDFWSVHNYFRPLEVWTDRHAKPARAFVISEFGGLTMYVAGHSSLESAYGYDTFNDLAEWRKAVRKTLEEAESLEHAGLIGYVYTQVSDVEEETNGLLTYDRRINKLAE